MVKVTKNGISRFVAHEKVGFYEAEGYSVESSAEKTPVKLSKAPRKKTSGTKE